MASTFHGTDWTHEIVVVSEGMTQGVRYAYACDVEEAKIVARAVSRVMPGEVRIYAALKQLPHSSYRGGWRVT